MQLFTLGLNHQTAPVSVREKLAFSAESLPAALASLLGQHEVKEAAIVSTCNRTEIYCNTPNPQAATHWLASYHQVAEDEIRPYLYLLPSDQAVRHAFRVASGLDSMVLGEAQILGQLKDSVRQAQHAGSLGILLNALFQRTFSVAKEVRTRTEIGANSVSMAAAAVRLAERIFPSVRGTRVLFIGAGEMIELCATHFAAQCPRSITVANRTLERARTLAAQFGGQAITLAELPAQLAAHDIVVTSTGSTLPILGKGMVERALKARRRQPIFMVDLAVPRDVEAEVAELEDVYLYTVDDLAGVVQEGRDRRQHAVHEAESIIDDKVAEFMSWMEGRDVVPLIRSLRDRAERLRRHELEKACRALDRGDDPRRVLESLASSLTNKFTHLPTHALNHAAADERDGLIDAVSRIYQIHDPD